MLCGFMLGDLADKIHGFWFGKIGENGLCAPEKSARWWKKDGGFDRLVERTFGRFLPLAARGELDRMLRTPRGALAFIVLTDQFPRNAHRGLPMSFAFDPVALAACRKCMDAGFGAALAPVERVFFHMPLMHSEDLSVQKLSVGIFDSLAGEFKDVPGLSGSLNSSAAFARRHFEIIRRFGRYPHRNAILGRESTPEEVEFLKRPGSSF